jgi:amidophosphoribosyltransferase
MRIATEKPQEECGVFGIFGHPEASILAALGLHALQHRGQEACGIVSYDGTAFHLERHLGLVGDNFGEAALDLQKRLPGYCAIGHVRYATSGGSTPRNVQPLFADLASGGVALGHNGNLTNARLLRRDLVENGAIFQSTMDTEVILHLVARSQRPMFVDRFIDALSQIEGGYALVALTEHRLVGARDPLGLRPLILGNLDGAPVLVSETCALDIMGAQFIREIEPGEVVVIGTQGIESLRPFPALTPRPCLFEYVYFARPDSVIAGRSVYAVRRAMGMQLAREHPAEADVIVPVPDSGVPAALGFSEHCGVPFQLGIIRNHYVGRTFIQPTQASRQLGVRMKHSANTAEIRGKRVVLVDDSVVRGNTSKKIVRMVREAGAAEVHLRSASPPIRHPDFYGIDMPSERELMAARMSLTEMAQELEVDSLGFLSLEGLYGALGLTARNANDPQFADHCFSGRYPTVLADLKMTDTNPVQQMSLLHEVGVRG